MHSCKYDVFFNWTLTYTCNFSCKYCIQTFSTNPIIKYLENLEPIANLVQKGHQIYNKVNLKKIRKHIIDIPSVVSVLNRLNKTARVRLTGGEPLLLPDIIELCREISQKHYIDLESNFTTNRVKDFCDAINPERVIEINAAFHIDELERTNKIDRYLSNLILCKEKGFNVRAFSISYPPVINDILKYKKIFKDLGLELNAYSYIGYYKGKDYPAAYSDKELALLNIDSESIQNHQTFKNRQCIAGYGFFVIYPNGDIHPCYSVRKKLGNIYTGLSSVEPFFICPYKKCACDPKLIAPEGYSHILKSKAKAFSV